MEKEYSKSQLYRIGRVYRSLARLLPTEGRDYNVGFSFDDSAESVSIEFKPHNELGKLWCDYCRKALEAGRIL